MITPRKVILALLAITIFTGLTYWLTKGGKIIGIDPVPSTAGKIAYVSDQNGGSDVYMTDVTGSGNAVNITGDNKHSDSEPAWSENGEQIALTSDRNGVTRQLYIMDARPGTTIRQLTNTSTTKELPTFGGGDLIFFLDAGKISRIDTSSTDMDIIFPTLEDLKEHFAPLFESGGLTSLVSSADGKLLATTLRQESGNALLAYLPDKKQLACLGVSQRLKVSMLENDQIAALFIGCDMETTPLRKPLVLFNPEASSPEMIGKLPRLMGRIKLGPETGDNQNAGLLLEPPREGGANILVIFDNHLNPKIALPLPESLVPSGFTISPDGKTAIITANTGTPSGVLTVTLDGSQQGGLLSPLPATEPVFSPDGSKVAFVSKDDIYISSIGSPGDPINLTKGKGKNHTPVWSPAKSKGK